MPSAPAPDAIAIIAAKPLISTGVAAELAAI
jgi:hypothetical protein